MANHGFSAPAIAAFGQPEVEYYYLVRIDFSLPVYFSLAPYDITNSIDGNLYISDGLILSTPEVTESIKIKPSTITIEMSGASELMHTLTVTENYRNAPVTIYLHEASTGETAQVFAGTIDSFDSDSNDRSGKSSVRWKVANHWTNWKAKAGRFISYDEQVNLYGTTDLGLFYASVSAVQSSYSPEAWNYARLTARDKVLHESLRYSDSFNVLEANESEFKEKLPLVYGTRKVEGFRVFSDFELVAHGNVDLYDYYWEIWVLAEGECSRMLDVSFDGESYNDSPAMQQYIKINFHGGADNQAADADMVAANFAFDPWNSLFKLSGICYIAIRYEHNASLWNASNPPKSPLVHLEGKKLFDPSNGQSFYSENNVLVLRDYITNTIYGKGIQDTSLNTTKFLQGIDYAYTLGDEHDGANAGQIPFFAYNGYLDTKKEIKKNVEDILFTMRGHLPYVNGKYKLVIDRHDDTGTFIIDADNIQGSFKVIDGAISTLLNEVTYDFVDIDSAGDEIEEQIVEKNAAYLLEDKGKVLRKSYTNKAETNKYRARNRVNTLLKESREQIRAEVSLYNMDAIQVEAGDIVLVNSAMQGWNEKPFRVEEWKLTKDSIDLKLREYEKVVYDWTVLPNVGITSNSGKPSPFNINPITNLVLLSDGTTLYKQKDGTVIPRILVTFDPPSDIFNLGGYRVYVLQFGVGGEEYLYRTINNPLENNFYIDGLNDETTYIINIVAFNRFTEATRVGNAVFVKGKEEPPLDVVGFNASQNGELLIVRWQEATDADHFGTEIRYGRFGKTSWKDATPLTIATKGTSVTSKDIVEGDWTFYAKHIDTSGNESLIAVSSDIKFRTGSNILYQEEKSPFVISKSSILNDGFPYNTGTLQEVVHDLTDLLTVEIIVKKDVINSRTDFFSNFQLKFYNDVDGVHDMYLDLNTGEFNTTNANTLNATVDSAGDFWEVSYQVQRDNELSDNFKFDIIPAAGEGVNWTLNPASTGFIYVWRTRVLTSGGENLLVNPSDFHLTPWFGGDVQPHVGDSPNSVDGFVVHHTGKLVPKSQSLALNTGWQTFDKFVHDPVAICSYEAQVVDTGFDGTVRIHGEIDSALGFGEVGVADPQLLVDHRLSNTEFSGYEEWNVGNAYCRFVKWKIFLETSKGLVYIDKFLPTIDVDLSTNREQHTIENSGTVITYNQSFHLAPLASANGVTVNVGVLAYATITNVTQTQALVHVYNLNGDSVGGQAVITLTGIAVISEVVIPFDPAPTPKAVKFYTGLADHNGCASSIAPTWKAAGDLFTMALSDLGDKSIDMLGLYLASSGNSAVTAVSVATGGIPADWTLDEDGSGAGVGFLTRSNASPVLGDTVFTLIASNPLVSDPSPTFIIRVYDDTASIPTLVSVGANAGSNVVTANISESVYTSAGTASSYVLDFTLKVNNSIHSMTHASGGGTSVLKYIADVIIAPGDFIELIFARFTSDLKSTANDIPLASGTKQITIGSGADFTPVKAITFEGGSVGTLAKGGDGYSNTLSSAGSVYSDKNVYSGNRSCHVQMLPPPAAAQQGGIINFDGKIFDDEFWIRCIVFVPSGFNFTTGNTQGQKFLRCNARINGSNTGGGMFSYYLDDQGAHVNAYTQPNSDLWYDPGGPCDVAGGRACRKLGTVLYGQMNNLEMYIKWRSDNTGILRAWVNGVLEFEVLNYKTAYQNGDGVWQIQVFSGPQPHTYDAGQSLGVYVDDIIITDQTARPVNVDAQGNQMIGSWKSGQSVVTPPVGSVWDMGMRDFNTGVIGNKATGVDGFKTLRGVDQTFYADDEPYLGSNVAQCNLEINEHFWGGIMTFPEGVGNGGVIYVEYWSRIPDYFDFDIANGSMKYSVFSMKDGNGNTTFDSGRLHLSMRSGSGDRNFRLNREGSGVAPINYPTTGDLNPVKRNLWQKHNFEIGVGNIPRDDGGSSYIKHWLDDVLLIDEGGNRVIFGADWTVYEWKFLDYYNDLQATATPECAPYARRLWIDNIKVSAS